MAISPQSCMIFNGSVANGSKLLTNMVPSMLMYNEDGVGHDARQAPAATYVNKRERIYRYA